MISFLSRLLDIVAPRLCAVCGRRLTPGEDTICAPCNLHLPRTDFGSSPYDNEMARMFYGRIPLERCAALFYYKAGAEPSQIVYQLKYSRHPEIGIHLGRMAARELMPKQFFDGIDLIVAVPLTRDRQRQRGYNQSREIAQGISDETAIPIADGVVRRISFNGSQTHKQRWERAENVANAFAIVHPEKIRGRHLLLVDDVATTGATLCACAKELFKAGNISLSILTLGFSKS